MKRLLSCTLALVTLISCILLAPVRVNATETANADISSHSQGVPSSQLKQITAADPNAEKIVGKPGTGTPVDMVPITTPVKRSGTLAGYVPTEQEAYNIMIAQKAYFPEGMVYTNDNYYDWNGGIWYRGYGCAGFCFYLSDLCFGDAPCYQVYEFTYDQIRVGDILRVNNDSHSVTVMEKYSDYIVLAEANYGGRVHWGRIMSYNEVMEKTTFLLSRYPKQGWYTFDGYDYFYDNDVATVGWASDEDNNLYYFDSKGRMMTGWQEFSYGWRYFNEYGHMASGWKNIGGTWYYFSPIGTSNLIADIEAMYGLMQTGWAKADGAWYYFNSSGAMQTGWQQVGGKWYYLDSEMKTGWQNIGGKWYYLGTDGAMKTGWQQVGGKWYYLNSEMKTGWQQVGGKWYYLGTNGVMLTGWVQLSGKWYYLGTDGSIKTGWQNIGGKWYYLGTDGSTKTGWQNVDGKWYYLGTDGAVKTGWQNIGGKWYYLNSEMKTGWQQIGGKWYYLNSEMKTGWQQISGKWYYLGTNGVMQTGWVQLSGKWYYLNSSGVMVTGTQTIDGKTYKFNSNGVWIG